MWGTMLRGLFILYIMFVFFMGFATHAAVTFIFEEATPLEQITRPAVQRQILLDSPVIEPAEKESPYDWVKERQVRIYPDRVVVELDNPQWSTYTNTNSMDPVLDDKTHGIQIIPQSIEDIHVGDIISYAPEDFDGILIHRVIQVDYDNLGWYAIVKGDNNPHPDPNKVRFNQIKRILVMIIY